MWNGLGQEPVSGSCEHRNTHLVPTGSGEFLD